MHFSMIHPTDAVRMVEAEQTRYFSDQQVLSEAAKSQSSLLQRITNRFMPARPAAVAASSCCA